MMITKEEYEHKIVSNILKSANSIENARKKKADYVVVSPQTMKILEDEAKSKGINIETLVKQHMNLQ